MAIVNGTRKGTRNQKRQVSVGTARIEADDITANADVVELFSIPNDSVVLDVDVSIEEAFNPGTTLTVQIDYDGTQIMAPVDLTVVGLSNAATAQFDTGVGGLATMTIALSGTKPTVGKADIMVQYIEYEKTSGELTSFSASP